MEIRDKNENILRLNNLLNEHFEKLIQNDASATQVLQEQISKRDKDIT